jgi:hypothetical protein
VAGREICKKTVHFIIRGTHPFGKLRAGSSKIAKGGAASGS